jgi:hypothetical protein
VCSYNKYLQIAARVIRKSLKEEARIKAEKRGPLELRYVKWEVGIPFTMRLLLHWVEEVADAGGVGWMQNGKPSEPQNLTN